MSKKIYTGEEKVIGGVTFRKVKIIDVDESEKPRLKTDKEKAIERSIDRNRWFEKNVIPSIKSKNKTDVNDDDLEEWFQDPNN